MNKYDNVYPGGVLVDADENGQPTSIRYHVYNDGPTGEYQIVTEPVDPSIAMDELLNTLTSAYGFEIKHD